MREIKFRIWCKQTDEMHTVERMGFEEGELWYVEDEDRETQPPYFMDRNDSVLMQYTGLKDKNGREIYEGDILKFEHLHNYANELQVVTRDEFMWGTDEYGFQEMIERNYKFEIIGNIYGNPELLEETK